MYYIQNSAHTKGTRETLNQSGGEKEMFGKNKKNSKRANSNAESGADMSSKSSSAKNCGSASSKRNNSSSK